MTVGKMFTGRMTRKQFIYGYVYTFAFMLALVVVQMVVATIIDIKTLNMFLGLFFGACSFVVGFLALGMNIRRFHDLDTTGWAVLSGLIPYLNFAVFVYLLCAKTKPGVNKYGEESNGDISLNSLFPTK